MRRNLCAVLGPESFFLCLPFSELELLLWFSFAQLFLGVLMQLRGGENHTWVALQQNKARVSAGADSY